MAFTEWFLSDDWKLWQDSQWASYINTFGVLRFAEFNTMPREKLFAQLESIFVARVIYICGVIVTGEVVNKEIEEWCICVFSLGKIWFCFVFKAG